MELATLANMSTIRRCLSVAALLGVLACGGETSSPEVCEEACRTWDACIGADDWYPYEQCAAACRAEGDWDQSYVDCLKSYSSCTDMEGSCS